VLEPVLVLAALVAGVTGAWSPCGLSMVETLAPDGYASRLRTSLLACATFTAGALAGGTATFGGLAVVGAALGAGTTTALVAGATLALAAAVGEARGLRIVPQIRRQVPESWRRRLPVPLAAGLYGVLLGLGFTTFILSFAVWALAGVSVALGEPALGLLIGAGFGVGRALPVILLAPAVGTGLGGRTHAAMAERPAIYRGLRMLDAAAMLACSVLLGAGPAIAASAAGSRGAHIAVTAGPATDPSAGSGGLAWQEPRGGGVLRHDGREIPLAGRHPVISGGEVAWHDHDRVSFAATATLAPSGAEPTPGADVFGFSERWVVWRSDRGDGGQLLQTRPRHDPAAPTRTLESVPARAQVGRPVVDGDRVVYHLAGRNGSRIVLRDLASGSARVLRHTRRALLLNPTLAGDTLVHVSSTARVQELLLGSVAGSDRSLYATAPTVRRDAGREPGLRRHRHYRFIRGRYRAVAPPRLPPRPPRGSTVTLWTTALDPAAAYVTRLTHRGARTRAEVLRVAR
jgi:hypothetical protein